MSANEVPDLSFDIYNHQFIKMKDMRSNLLIMQLFIIGLLACGNKQHRKEERMLKKERSEVANATSDLSLAVKATDEAGWDGEIIYDRFSIEVQQRLTADSTDLAKHKMALMGQHKNVPLRYRAKIKKMEGQIRELKSRAAHYRHKGKADWEDFELLFRYDMKQLEKALSKLPR